MSRARPSLPAYIRLPDGLRFVGSVNLARDGQLCFQPKQSLAQVPPEGLPVHLVVAGLPDDEEAQLSIASSIDECNSRELLLSTDEDLPPALKAALQPDTAALKAPEGTGSYLLESMRDTGANRLVKAMQKFVVELSDELFDISTSSRYGASDRHEHYDALNALKRQNREFLDTFARLLRESLARTDKDQATQTFADLKNASAQNLDLVALEEMDQKLAIDKIVTALFEVHRVALECLTIRAALVGKLEPRETRTPFHPAYIVQAFAQAFSDVSTNPIVLKDALRFFGRRYTPVLDTVYPSLNALFINAGVEPGLEADIARHGSILHPVERRIVKSPAKAEPTRDAAAEAEAQGSPPSAAADQAVAADRAAIDGGIAKDEARDGRGADTPRPAASVAGPGSDSSAPAPGFRDRHDAMYEAVLNALNTGRRAATTTPGPAAAGTGAAEMAGTAAGPATSSPGGPPPSGSVTAGQAPARDAAADVATLSPQMVQEALMSLQAAQPGASSLAELEPLESLILGPDGKPARLERDEANRLGFVDNVFRTLHNNFEVSGDMAPSLAQLRVPLARLSLREPRFFTQPEHPAHKLLDRLSVLASADHTVNQAVKNKVQGVINRVVENYDDDSSVFAEAQEELDRLLEQQGRVQHRNVERVISGLEGQEKLTRAQRRVEELLGRHLDQKASPDSLLELLDGGWKAALVQLALREGHNGVAWREEEALLETLLKDLRDAATGALPREELADLRLRLRALDKRLQTASPGSVAHSSALRKIDAVLAGEQALATAPYAPADLGPKRPDPQRVEQLPRLRRWLQRVAELEEGAKLRYRDSEGRKRLMTLIWISEDRDRFAFVNERGQKIAELTAIQLARQLSKGARPPNLVDRMSVMDQSVYETLESAQKTLSFDRNMDSLTQLINGDSLLFQLRRSLRHAQARDSEHAFMLLDIDNFSLVNEVFDETSGDQVLAEFARLLAQLNDRRALTARIEGDQFGILLTYAGADDARRIAEKIRQDIGSSSLEVGGEAVSFTVSIGIALLSRTSDSAENVMGQAQAALDTAKSQGRDQVILYDVDTQEIVDYRRDRAASRKRLEEAMSTDGLVLRAQPIVQSAIGETRSDVHHYEILLSLRDESGELTSPQDFIMSAERFGYVTLVDKWVLRETFKWISQLMDRQKEVPELSINLSGTSITDNEFLDYVLEEISEHGVGTSRLCFEITETGAIDNLPKAADFVRTLKNLGCKFSLDDFGTGLASHKYLKELPVDYVKIDGTFITNVHRNPTDFAMAKSINDLAHFLGQQTVAECVEDMDMVPHLEEIGIDYLQGWGIGMPRELHEVTDLLDNLET